MNQLPRRAFVRAAASAVPAAALITGESSSGVIATLDRDLLLALGEVVLPSELGRHGIERVVTAFARWLDDYRAGAERDHGYGTGKIEQLPSSPRDVWNAQLAALDGVARTAFGKGFAQLRPPDRQHLVEQSLDSEAVTELSRPLHASYVAAGLLAYFYDTPEANDLCYRASIGKTTCRPLDQSPRRPEASP